MRAIALRHSRSSASAMLIKIEMLTIYGLLSSLPIIVSPPVIRLLSKERSLVI
jgi:hypothetical protein